MHEAWRVTRNAVALIREMSARPVLGLGMLLAPRKLREHLRVAFTLAISSYSRDIAHEHWREQDDRRGR